MHHEGFQRDLRAHVPRAPRDYQPGPGRFAMSRSPNPMNLVQVRGAALVAALALLAGVASGCNKKIHLPTVIQERPVLRLSAAPIDTLGPDGRKVSYVYHYRMDWVGYDPDGRIDHYLYTIDPPGS